MNIILPHVIPLAAIGYSLVYLLGGGGLVGAFFIFIAAKMFGK
jgi:ABC-type molybdate transport system permease subunit